MKKLKTTKMSEGIRLIYDKEDRIAYDGAMNFNCETFSINLSEETYTQLKIDCECVFTCRDVKANQSYSSGSTFFLRSDKIPRCGLEELAFSIFTEHTKSAIYDKTKSGAEWWTQVIDSEDDIGFHFDRDYGIELECDIYVYPQLATVTYFTDGGPTVIVNHTFIDECDYNYDNDQDHHNHSTEFHPCYSNQLLISTATKGKHLCFDGRLLHGAPSDLYRLPKIKSDKRITFLVNIWLNHIPIESKPMTKSLLKQLKAKHSNDLNVSLLKSTQIRTESCEEKSRCKKWNFHHQNKNLELMIPLPPIDIFEEWIQNSNVLEITYPNDDIRILISEKSKRRKR